MGYETEKPAVETPVLQAETTSQRPSEPAVVGRVELAAVPGSRRPYAAPQLRYLGKVADLTFGGLGSITDGGTHTGHNQKV